MQPERAKMDAAYAISLTRGTACLGSFPASGAHPAAGIRQDAGRLDLPHRFTPRSAGRQTAHRGQSAPTAPSLSLPLFLPKRIYLTCPTPNNNFLVYSVFIFYNK